MEKKLYTFDAGVDEATGTLRGYASVTGIVDRDGEIIANGAFSNLQELIDSGFVAVGHDWTGLPVGTIETAREDERGLYVEMSFHSTPEAQAARTVATERLARGKQVGLSIGFIADRDHREEIDGAMRRVIDSIRVFEVSLVTIPANPMAWATDAKGLTFDDEAEQVVILARRLAERAEAVAELRAEQGKHLSAERADQIKRAAAQLIRVAATAEKIDNNRLTELGGRIEKLKARITKNEH